MQGVLSWIASGWNIALVVLGLGLIIFLHELGHFLMAKKNKVRVEIFSLGFGRAIFSFRRGETEYRIAWLPLGGYVKMSGESLVDDHKGEPWELTSKTPWQRFQIFVAGAVMNLLLAFPLAILAYTLGKYEYPDQVGVPGTAEAWAGIMPGDVIREVDGRKIESLDKFRIEMIRRQKGTVVPVVIDRPDGKGGFQPMTVEVTAKRSEYHATEPVTTALGKVPVEGALYQAGVRSDDEIISVDGKPVYYALRLSEMLRAAVDREVVLGVRRREPDFNDTVFEARLRIPAKTWHVIPKDDRLIPMKVGMVQGGSAAYSALEPGDLIVRLNDKAIDSYGDLLAALATLPNTPVEVAVLREGEAKEQVLKFTTGVSPSGSGLLGVGPAESNLVAEVAKDSYFDRAGLRKGDRVIAIEGYSVRNFFGSPVEKGAKEAAAPPMMGLRGSKERTIAIKVERAGQIVELKLKTEPLVEGDLAAAGFPVNADGYPLIGHSQPFRRRVFGEAVAAGMREPVDVGVMTIDILRKLVTGGESAKGLSGPVGIIQVSYSVVQKSFGNFLWLLCLITVNLGIFNLLPIPILDGGHNVLLLIEVVRKWMGKPPPSEKFIAAFQYSGLIFILALFVFVTFNDFTRILR